MLTKTKLREQIEEFPEKFSVDELVERLILIEKIDHGIEQSEKDEVISDAEMTNEGVILLDIGVKITQCLEIK